MPVICDKCGLVGSGNEEAGFTKGGGWLCPNHRPKAKRKAKPEKPWPYPHASPAWCQTDANCRRAACGDAAIMAVTEGGLIDDEEIQIQVRDLIINLMHFGASQGLKLQDIRDLHEDALSDWEREVANEDQED